jgi:spermidine/putrescine transport system permease protein
MFAIPEILGGKDDWLVGNLIKESFLGTRDWPFGSMLSLMLTLAVLAVAGRPRGLRNGGVERA